MIQRFDDVMRSVRSALDRLRDKGAFSVMGGSFFMKIAGFLGSIVLVRVISKESYGLLSHVENIYNYAYTFAGLGLNYAVFRYVVLAQDVSEKRAVVRFALSRGMIINVIIIVGASFFAFTLPQSDSFHDTPALLSIMLLALPLQYSFETGQFTLRALFKNNEYARNAVIATVLVWFSKVVGAKLFGVAGAATAWPAAYIVVAFFVLQYVLTDALRCEGSSSVSTQQQREMHVYSIQYMITNGLWALFLQNDLFLIGLLTDDAALVADYKVAYAIPAALAILSSSIGIFVAPYFVKQEENHAWVWNNYKKVLIGTGGLVLFVALFVALLSKPLVGVLFGEQYSGITPLLNLLLVVAIINNGLRYPTANLFASMGIIKINMATAIAGMVLQVVLDVLLIPTFGVYGAALTSIIVYFAMALGVIVPFVFRYRH